ELPVAPAIVDQHDPARAGLVREDALHDVAGALHLRRLRADWDQHREGRERRTDLPHDGSSLDATLVRARASRASGSARDDFGGTTRHGTAAGQITARPDPDPARDGCRAPGIETRVSGA